MILNLNFCKLFDSLNHNNIKVLSKSFIVVVLFLSLLTNSFLGFVNLNENKDYSFTKFTSSNSTNLNSDSSLRITYFNKNYFKFTNIEKSKFVNTFSFYLYLVEINELFELELDDFIDCFSKDYKFYNLFIFSSVAFDKFEIFQAKTIPLYILFHCLKIHLSL